MYGAFCIKLYSVAMGGMMGLCCAVGLYRCSTKAYPGDAFIKIIRANINK